MAFALPAATERVTIPSREVFTTDPEVLTWRT